MCHETSSRVQSIPSGLLAQMLSLQVFDYSFNDLVCHKMSGQSIHLQMIPPCNTTTSSSPSSQHHKGEKVAAGFLGFEVVVLAVLVYYLVSCCVSCRRKKKLRARL